MDPESYPWLLSQILDELKLVSKEKATLHSKSIGITEILQSSEESRRYISGSSGEGFRSFCSDIDAMDIFHNYIIMYDNTKQGMPVVINPKAVFLVKKGDCRPGFVNLQIGQYGNAVDKLIFNSIVPIGDSYFLSSELLREERTEILHSLGLQCSSTGPSNKVDLPKDLKQTMDMVAAFYFCDWPHDAYEWISRTRIFGWPSKHIVDNIVNMGCYIVPIGDKCSEDTFLQWRISFATAEKYLVQTLNNIQFQVYGLLKYMLQQIKYRMKHDTGEDDILCSYFMKTLIFYAVENSPQPLWNEKNIFVCFRFCLTMLIDWVQSGYCPNYFIKTNNMFKRKVHAGNKIKVLNILYELKDMKWEALFVGSAHQPSIWGLLQCPGILKILMNYKTPTMKENQRDLILFNAMRYFAAVKVESMVPFRKAMTKLSDADSDTSEMLFYSALTKLLARLAMKSFQHHHTIDGNKHTYSAHKKIKHWMSLAFGTDKLYFATFYYHAGSYRKVIELCRSITSSITITDDRRYRNAFCGRGYSLNYKLNQAFSDFVVFPTKFLYFCPPFLRLEVCYLRPYPLMVPPKPYAMFLSFMCNHEIGHTKERDKELNDLLAIRYEVYRDREFHWIVHTLIGLCYQIKGENLNALRAYQDSWTANSHGNPARQRIEALQRYLRPTKRK